MMLEGPQPQPELGCGKRLPAAGPDKALAMLADGAATRNTLSERPRMLAWGETQRLLLAATDVNSQSHVKMMH